MEIRLGETVILNGSTVNTPLTCTCSGSVNTRPLNGNEPTSSELQKGVKSNTLTITFPGRVDRGDIIEAIEEMRQANIDVDISSDVDFDRSIKLRKIRTVQIISFKTTDSNGPNDKEVPCVLTLFQRNSPDELAKIDAEENLSITPSDPASGFTIAETIAFHSTKQKETVGLFLGDSVT